MVVYDKTAGQTVGQVQVSLTGFQQYGFLLFRVAGTGSVARRAGNAVGNTICVGQRDRSVDGRHRCERFPIKSAARIV